MSVRTLHLDVFSGISGDMTLAALLDLGADEAAVRRGLDAVGVDSARLSVDRRQVSAIDACDVRVTDVATAEPRHHTHWADIRRRIEAAGLPAEAADKALRIFAALAKAEAKVHGGRAEAVHFHEVGADDSIADIVGVAVALHSLAPDRITCSPITVGCGFIDTAHGRLPVPVPATAELLAGIATRPAGVEGELVTPTGAAIVAALVDEVVDWPNFAPSAVGYGAGDRQIADRPNLLRAILGEASVAEAEPVWDVRANIDDMTGEEHGFLLERLFEAGALDAWFVPIQMKKGRPAVQVGSLTTGATLDAVTRALLTHSSTAGLRLNRVERRVLPRNMRTVQTPYGPIRVKTIEGPEGPRHMPEHDDCAAAALEGQVSLRQVREAACRATE